MITRDEWMDSKEAVDEYAKWRASPYGQMEMTVLLTECSKLSVPAADKTGRVQVENCSFALGFSAGRRWILDCMMSMTKFGKQEEPIATFEDPMGEGKTQDGFR